MNRKQAEQIITEYLKKLYGFALAKTATLQDAEDLTQDIALKLYPALLNTDIDNISAFVWRVAKNTLANYYRGKAKSGIGVPFDEISEILLNDEGVDVQFEKAETIKKLQSEIAYLSKMQRKIVILYYYENKKQGEISELLSVPIGTVKWHLFEAKKEMMKGMKTMRDSSELKFNPIKFTIMGVNGSVGTMGGTSNFFRSTLSQNIAYSVLREARTINEIADCLGVSPVYIESEVEFLEEYGFLIKKGGKYLANMLIDEPNENSYEIVRLQEEMYSKAAKIFANELYDQLSESNLLEDDNCVVCNSFVGFDNDKPIYKRDKNFILWSLIPYIGAVSGENLMEHTISFDEVATIRPDGGKNIAYAGFDIVEGPRQKYFESMLKWCGPCWNANDKYMLWMIDSEWSDRRVNDNYHISVVRDLSLFNSFLNGNTLSADEYAYMVEKGYLKKVGVNENLISSLQIVWIRDSEAKRKLIAIGDKIKEKYKGEFDKLKFPFIKAVMKNTPEQLKKVQAYGMQSIFFADGWFLLYCMKELVENGKLKIPMEEQKKSLTTIIVPNN